MKLFLTKITISPDSSKLKVSIIRLSPAGKRLISINKRECILAGRFL